MSNFSLKDISKILEMLEERDVTEFCLEKEGEKISLKRGSDAPVQQIIAAPAAVEQAPVVVQQALVQQVLKRTTLMTWL